MPQARGPQIFKKPRSHLKILGDKEGDKKFHTDDPKIFRHDQTTFSHQGDQAPPDLCTLALDSDTGSETPNTRFPFPIGKNAQVNHLRVSTLHLLYKLPIGACRSRN